MKKSIHSFLQKLTTMKKVKLILLLLFGIFVNQPALFSASASIIEPVTNQWQANYKLSDFIRMNPNDLQKLTGKKMNFPERIAFKIAQHKMKRYLKKNNDVTVAQFLKTEEKEKKKFSFLWFMIGLLGPLIGIFTFSIAAFIFFLITPIALVYLIKTNKSEKSSLWLGWIAGVVILLVLAVIALTSTFSF